VSNKSLPIVVAALVLTSSLAAWAGNTGLWPPPAPKHSQQFRETQSALGYASTVTDLNRNTANRRNWHNNVGGWY
jgi:hypothetical protein